MTIFNRVILAILMWATLGAGTTLASIVQPLVNTDWVADNLDNKTTVMIKLDSLVDTKNNFPFEYQHIGIVLDTNLC